MSGISKHAQEVNRHGRLEKRRKGDATDAVVERLAKVRKLMQSTSSHTFDSAFTQVCQEELRPMVAVPAKAAPKIAITDPRVSNPVPVNKPQPKLFLVRGNECGLRYPLFRK